MGRTEDSEVLRKLEVLESLAENPEARQADLATSLGMAVGTVNWLLKRMSKAGFIKVKRIGRWQWKYILTPRGFAEKARLTRQYVRRSMSLYRETRKRVHKLLANLKDEGCNSIRIDGNPGNDLVDICRLTCLEEGMSVRDSKEESVPRLLIDGREVLLKWPGVPGMEESRLGANTTREGT